MHPRLTTLVFAVWGSWPILKVMLHFVRLSINYNSLTVTATCDCLPDRDIMNGRGAKNNWTLLLWCSESHAVTALNVTSTVCMLLLTAFYMVKVALSCLLSDTLSYWSLSIHHRIWLQIFCFPVYSIISISPPKSLDCWPVLAGFSCPWFLV